jgi:ribosome-binding factor A
MNRSANKAVTASKSHRLLRVGELLRHSLSAILMRGDIRDPALTGTSVTVTEVKVSPDLHNATVFVMPLGGVHADEILEGFARCAGFLRGQLSKTVELRYVPKLTFEIDRTFDAVDRMEKMFKDPKVAQDLGKASLSAPQDDEDPGEAGA